MEDKMRKTRIQEARIATKRMNMEMMDGRRDNI
jgi:hypothetical protein